MSDWSVFLNIMHKIVEDCRVLFEEDVRSMLYFGHTSVESGTETEDGWIEIFADRKGGLQVKVCHCSGGHPCPTLEAAIAAALPRWRDIEDQYVAEWHADHDDDWWQEALLQDFSGWSDLSDGSE